MFSKLFKSIFQNKKILLLVLLGTFLYLFLADTSFAVDQAKTFEETKTKIAWVVQFISTVIAVFLALITYLVTMFLSPEWINGSLFWLNSVFKSIWILVSNLVYLIFAFILIWIAFMNIIWKWWDKYQLKQALPKFIVGILIVPFSWFLVNFILSLSSVLTISALNLPFDSFPTYATKMQGVSIPTSCEFNPDNLWKSTGPTDLNKILKCKPDESKKLIDLINSDKSWDSIFWIIAVYTYWILSLENFDYLNASYIWKVENMVQLVVKLVFDFLFIVVYAILMIALWLVLMTRWIYLWIYMMMSPIFGLMYFFDKSEWWSWFFEKFNLKQFISLAFVPVFSMLALSFWLLFIYVVWNWMTEWPSASTPESNISIDKNTFKINDVSFTLSWSASSEQNITEFFKTIWTNSANATLWVVGTLILKIFGIVVLWWAMMAALRTNEITKAVIEPLYQFWTKVWEMAKASPQYLPVFGGQSMSSLSTAAWVVSNTISSKQAEKGNKLAEKFLPSKWTDKEYWEVMIKNPANQNDAISNIRQLNWIWKSQDIANSSKAIEAYSKNLQKLSQEWIFSDSKKANELIEKLNKEWKWNAEVVREVLSELDWLVKDSNYSIVWWAWRTDKWQIDSELWSWKSQTPWTPASWTQTINLNIKNEWLNSNLYKTDSSGKITWVTDAQAVASHISETNLLTREQFIDEFVKKLITEKWRSNITDENARKIAQEVASKITNFKTTP